jgi:hypothetical protein
MKAESHIRFLASQLRQIKEENERLLVELRERGNLPRANVKGQRRLQGPPTAPKKERANIIRSV